MYVYIYVIIFLFLFLREFIRVKWSENENEYGERRIFIFGELREEESLSLSFPKGWLVAVEWNQLIVNEL